MLPALDYTSYRARREKVPGGDNGPLRLGPFRLL